MDGSDKIKPMVIGKYAQPRCFKRTKSLPCSYEHNTKAWMTSGLFAQWLRAFDARIGGKNRKVALFVDNCPAHPRIDLRNTELVFLPPNSTSILQPLDQGLIKLLKQNYRAMLVNFVVRQLELKNLMRMKWSILDAMHAVVSCWDNISPEVISSCFKHAGFSAQRVPEDEEIEDDKGTEDPEGWEVIEGHFGPCTFKSFVEVDDSAPSREELTDDAILFAVRNDIVESSSYSEDSEDDVVNLPPKQEVLKALQVISNVYRASSASADDLLAFSAVEKYVMRATGGKLKQTTLDSFVNT